MREAGIRRVVVVTASEDDEVARTVRDYVPGAVVAPQQRPLGTGHAALSARAVVGEATQVLILNADLPLLTERTLRDFMQRHIGEQPVLSFLPAYLEDPSCDRRIPRQNGRTSGLVVEYL